MDSQLQSVYFPTGFSMQDYDKLNEVLAAIQLSYSPDRLEHLERRRRGAEGKDRGTEFERFYGVHKIMQEAFSCRTGNRDGRSCRVTTSAVVDIDDLVLIRDGYVHFAQVKDRVAVGWPEIVERFSAQLDDLRRYELLPLCEVQLVVSRDDVRKDLEAKKPQDLAPVKVRWFRNVDEDFDPFAENMIAENADPSARKNVRHHIYDAWRTLEFSATIAEIVDRANRLSYGNIRELGDYTLIDDDLTWRLKAIEFLEVKQVGNRLYYGYEGQNLAPLRWRIDTPQWERFRDRLLDAEDLDFMGFLHLLGDIE